MFRRYPGNVLKGMGARYFDGVFFNVFGVFSIAYLTSTLKISRTDALLGAGTTAIAYETVQLPSGLLPLLYPMSEVAGCLAPQVGAYWLQKAQGGRGVLMGGVGGVANAKVVVIGAGAIGSFVVAGLCHLVDVEITVIDFPGPRLERAARMGAARTLVPSPAIGDEVAELFDGRRPNVVVEASGAPMQLEAAVRIVADGGRVLAVGIPKGRPEIDVGAMVFREITLDSTLAHVCDADLPTALAVLAGGNLGDEFIASPVPLADLGQSLDRLASGQVEHKILIDPVL
mgnify:CR=1 FL=1